MSRLDSFIRRLEAQRSCLAAAAAAIVDVPGPVLELGLGAGRSYDHLRELLPGRELYVFEREPTVGGALAPDPEHLVLGDFLETLPGALTRIGAPAALVHADIGSFSASSSRALAAAVAPLLDPLLRPGALVVGDQPMRAGRWAPVALPPGVAHERYHMYRVEER